MALNQHVTAEQYNQAMHDAVNAYYTHAMNDPSMSHEEAINSTAQMAERGLAAQEEFQANLDANQELDNGQQEDPGLTNDDSAGLDNGDDGIDGGDDGIDGGIE